MQADGRLNYMGRMGPANGMTTAEMQAQVVRYHVVRSSVIRNAVPIVILVTIASKYIGTYALGAALLLQLAIVVLFLRTRENLGRQTIKQKRESLTSPLSPSVIACAYSSGSGTK